MEDMVDPYVYDFSQGIWTFNSVNKENFQEFERELDSQANILRNKGEIEKAQEMEMKLVKFQHYIRADETYENMSILSYSYESIGKNSK